MVKSGRLPEFYPIALRISDPAESADALHGLRFVIHYRTPISQLREHRVQVPDPEVQHGLLGVRTEVVGPGLKCREDRKSLPLTPYTVVIGVKPQEIPLPGRKRRRVSGSQEVPTYSNHAFHIGIVPRLTRTCSFSRFLSLSGCASLTAGSES
jgi:hypothetical protein